MSKNIITPTFRVAFPNVFVPVSYQGIGAPQYSISMIFDIDSDLKELKAAILEIAKITFPKRDIKTLKLPFRDGNTILHKETGEQYDMYKNKLVFTASSKKRRPEIINAKKEPITSEGDFYAGCYARASILPYAYTLNGGGVSLGLQNIQKIRQGEPFISFVAADDEFDRVEMPDDSDIKPEESAFSDLM